MSSQVSSENPQWIDKALWVLVVAVVVSAIGANYYFSNYSLLYRVVGLVIGAGIGFSVFVKTRLGLKAWTLGVESITEVRKIHWPTRQETLQTTLIVVLMVLVMGVFLWSADFVLLRVVKWLGHWGA